VDCAGKGKMRQIISDDYEAERKRMADKFGLRRGRKNIKKRNETV